MIETAIFTRASAYAGLTALVGTRIYPIAAPQGVTAPFVVYETISGVPETAMNADPGLTFKRMQFTCISRTQLEAHQIAEQVRQCFQRWRGTVSGVVVQDSFIENAASASYDAATKLFAVSLDVRIIHQE